MPALVRKFLVIAAVDAIFLQPHVHRSQKPVPGLQIAYGRNDIKSTSTYPDDISSQPSLEAHGIVGLFTVASFSYLVLITSRKQVAQIYGRPIYVISGVTVLPLSSYSEARLVVESSKQALAQGADHADEDTSDSEAEHEEPSTGLPGHDDEEPSTPFNESRGKPGHTKAKDSIAQDVISKRGAYGRFAERWFSKKGWTAERQRAQGMSSDPDLNASVKASEKKIDETARASNLEQPQPDSDNEDNNTGLAGSNLSDTPSVAVALLPKLLRTVRMLLNSQSFYFSYDHDITRRMGSVSSKGTDVPLYKQADPQFHWNASLSQPLLDATQQHFVIPVMQGFISQRAFTVDKHEKTITDTKETAGEVIELQDVAANGKAEPESSKHKDFLVTMISRRSVGRPGLRYLRRGVDDHGNAANHVETEQILSDPAWKPESKIYSFTQIRGSIPLFFSQSPYSLKPVPLLSHSFETNQAAFRKHFTNVMNRYGQAQVALLVDKHGTEAKIGEEYEKHAQYLNEHNGVSGKKLGFEWFDFHHVCRGMKFENVSILMDTLDEPLSSFGYAIEEDRRLSNPQQGILRTSCMDCLDRTNVVQSACGRWALQKQLADEGIALDMQGDPSTRWFDVMWADNGDAISKQYASTAALKGDYTRTRKRDYRGALNDFGLTLGRYYNNIVNDFFSQAAIDFLLGQVTDVVFEEFEANMMSADPGMSMSKVRQNAVDISVKIVVEDRTEELRGGWVMATPHVTNTLNSTPLEEMVLLITDAALYAVRFNWTTEKVSAFERVEFKDIVHVHRGTYITNTLSSLQTDAKKNVGFVIQYKAGDESIARINTRSMSTSAGIQAEQAEELNRPTDILEGSASNILPGATQPSEGQTVTKDIVKNISQSITGKASVESRILAFKALPSRGGVRAQFQSSYDNHSNEPSEGELVKTVCDEIARMAGQTSSWIEEKDVVSLADAKKNTGIIESLGHSLKKLVWA